MRNAFLISVLTGALVLSAAAVYAGAPLSGTWKSTNGDFDEGTATSKWAAGDFLGVGNVLFGQSSSTGLFTNDWSISCPIVVSVLPLSGPVGPTGNYTFLISYSGGYFYLGGPGNPWNGGDAVYTGIIDSYTEIRTIQTAGGKIVGAVSDHAVNAHLQGYPQTCIAWAIGNGVLRGGDAPSLPLPFDYGVLQSAKSSAYPDYHDSSCTPGNGPGHWDDIRDLTLSITGCTVATEPTTWGAVKSKYRD